MSAAILKPAQYSPKLIRRKPLKHVKLIPLRRSRRLAYGELSSVTVCIAALINWIYPNKEIGRAVITVADRMLTSGDIEYEPAQLKVSFLRKRIIVLVAGDITIHSEALTIVGKTLASSPEDDVEIIADLYAAALKTIKNNRAASEYLSPLNLDTTSFILQQKHMSSNLVFEIVNQLQGYSLDVEALVVGCDERLSAHIFHIDGNGNKSMHDDINFASIGIGSNHAKSQFMVSRYPKIIYYYRALPILYTAKRRAEVAPGVGKDADWILITREGWSFVDQSVINELGAAYDEFQEMTLQKLNEVERRLEGVFKMAAEKDKQSQMPSEAQKDEENMDNPEANL